MVIIHVTMEVLDENKQILEDGLSFVSKEAIKLEGCLRYEWFRHPILKGKYFAIGEFQSMKYFQDYKNSAVVEFIVNQILPLTLVKPSFKHFQGEIFEQG